MTEVKERKNFRPITVDGVQYRYCITGQRGPGARGVVIYGPDNVRKLVGNLNEVGIPEDHLTDRIGHAVWRGKHGETVWGKRQVAWVIANITHKKT